MNTSYYFDQIIQEFAASIQLADEKRPQKVSNRGRIYQHGIGPFTEDETVDLVLAEFPTNWKNCQFLRSIPYPSNKRSKCDLRISAPNGDLFIEIKLMRILGDNGKLNDNITMHILPPYPKQRSALTDIKKLQQSEFDGNKAIVIYGYDTQNFPMSIMMNCFEHLAAEDLISPPLVYEFNGLIHPVHRSGWVYGWLMK